MVACAATLGTVSLTCLGLAVQQVALHGRRTGVDVWLLFCVATLFGATAISFARRWPNALLFAYPSGCLLVGLSLLILFLVGVTGYDVSYPTVSVVLAIGGLALGCLTALSAYALDKGAA